MLTSILNLKMLGGVIIKYSYIPDIIQSKTKGTYYVVRLAILDENNIVLVKGQPLIWINEDIYKKLLNI